MPSPFQPFLFLRRGRVWTIVFPGPDGRKRQKAIKGLRGPEDEGKAKRVLAAFVRRREAGAQLATGGDDGGPLTVAKWAATWLASREARGISTVADYRSRLEHHVLPLIGFKRLDAIRTVDIEEVMRAVAEIGRAQRTQRHVFYTMNAMFERAVNRDPPLLDRNPCAAIPEEDRPRKEDADPEWRPTAKFTRQEVEALITSPLLPWDRRVFYALLFLAGGRFGEIAALRIRHYKPEARPLGELVIAHSYNSKKRLTKGTKTGVTRLVPVHPWLADILGAWLGGGWAEMMGRAPTADDILIPTRRGTHRTVSTMWKQMNGEAANPAKGFSGLKGDLERLGLRRRRQHDARRTFISLCRSDGARKDLLQLITHGRNNEDVMESYSELEWKRLCRQVSKLKLGPSAAAGEMIEERRGAKLLEGGLPSGCHATEVAGMITEIGATPAGFENHHIPGQPSPSEATRCNPRQKLTVAGPAGASTAAIDAHQGPMATVATLALRQALDALDRGRVDQARAILERALDEERGNGGVVAGGRP
jgi:integrase